MSSQTSKNNTPSTPATSSKAAQKAPVRPKDDSDSEDEEDQLRRQAFRASANVTSTPFDGRERLKLNPPATFDGIPRQLKGYLVQVRTYQAFHLEIFRNETEKVVHAATFLRGRALSWFEPLLQEWLNVPPEERRQEVTDIFSTFAGYERTLRSLFQEPDEKRQTERDLANLRQTKLASAYIAEFKRLATRLDMTEETKILQFYQGLKLEIKDEISKLDRPEDFLEYPRYMAPQTYNTTYGTHSGPMDLNATQYKKPRKDPKSGKCFKCDKTGHIARNCPKNQENIPDFRGKTEKPRGFNVTNYRQLRPDQHSTINWTTCYNNNCITHNSSKIDAGRYPQKPRGIRTLAVGNRVPMGTRQPVNLHRRETQLPEFTDSDALGKSDEEPLGQTHYIRTTNQSLTQKLSEDSEEESSEEETIPSNQYNATKENNPYIYEKKHIDLYRDDQLVQFPGLLLQTQIRHFTGPVNATFGDHPTLDTKYPQHAEIFWAECFRDNCGLHLNRKIIHNFLPRRRKATGIHEIYTTTDLPNWEIKIRLNTKPAAIFTPNDNYPMAYCNQKQFPYTRQLHLTKGRSETTDILAAKKEPYQLQTVEGKAVLYGNGTIETETVHLWMESYGRKEQITLNITEIGDKNVILGIPWLRRSNPRINWTTGQVQWEEPKNEPRLEPISEGSRLSISEERSNLTTLIDNIPAEYRIYGRLFSPEFETGLPEHNPFDHEIPLKKGTQPKFHKIYENLKKGYIKPLILPAGYPILFVPKKNGKLQLCVDYKQLNDITIKNSYNLIRIKEGEKWKTAFRTRRGHYEYLVMPFGLTNAPATFQTIINHVFRKCLNIFVVVYLDDILVFSKTLEEYKQYVHTVLKKLQNAKLLVEPEKCFFYSKQINFLKYIIAPGEIRMEKSKIQAVKEWPQPQNVKDVRAFLGFVNFYKRFIKGYGAIATPLTNITKKDLKFQWTEQTQQAFEQLRNAVAREPILKIPDPTKPFEVETDASDYAIGGQLSQRDEEGRLHPCAFFSQKLHGPEFNYQIYDKEFMAIIRAFEKWKPQLSGIKYEVLVYTDHKNLTHFTISKMLNKRQIKWSKFLLKFHFRIIYRKGTENGRADALSRRPDYENTIPKETRVIFTTDENGNLLPAHRNFIITNTVTTPEEIRRIHESKTHGHQGIFKIWKRLKQHHNFQGIRQEVRKAIKNCELCAKSKSARYKPYGLLQPLPTPGKAWQTIIMDFIVKLPPLEKLLTRTKYDSILVIVDKLTKYAYFLLYKESSNAEKIAYIFLRVIVSNYGLPENIITDRDKLFTSRFWKSLMEQLGTNHKLLTAFHPQTDGQTERANQILEQYLRCYVNHKQDDWVRLLPTAQFAYNSSENESTKTTPFYTNYGFNPTA
ncbi:hypothetical protein M9X92_011710 [Pyricularia oryzae]|nr:hypothetical protein M9X92_011710 [Pyricularia oryzae]